MYEQKKSHRKNSSSSKRSANTPVPDERVSSVSDNTGSGNISSGSKHHDEDNLAQSDVMRPLLSSNPSSSRANSPSRDGEGKEGPVDDNNAQTNEGETIGDLRPNENNSLSSPVATEGFGDDPNFDIKKYFAHKASLSGDSTISTSSTKNSPGEIVVKGKGEKYYVADDSAGDKKGNVSENENQSLLASTTTKLKKEGDVTCGDVFGDVMDTARQVLQQKIASVLVGGSAAEATVSYTTAPLPAASSSLTTAAVPPTAGTSSSSPIIAAPARNLSSRATSRTNSQFHSRQPSGLTHTHHNENDSNVGTYTRAHIGNSNSNNNDNNTATTADASLGSPPPSAFANECDTLSPHRSLSKRSNNNGVAHSGGGGGGGGEQQQVLMASSSSRATSSLQRRDNEEDRRGAEEEDREDENEECESGSSSAPPTQGGSPLAVSAARTLDINLKRVKKARLLCVSNLLILGLCLGLQGYAWIAYYQKTICDVYLKADVTFSVGSEIQNLRNSIQSYDPSPITSGDWLPAEFSISSTSSLSSSSSHHYYLSSNGNRQGFEAQQNRTTDGASRVTRSEARISSSFHNVTLRNIDRHAARGSGADTTNEDREDIVIPVAEFTSFVLEASIPYADLEENRAVEASSDTVTFSFAFPLSTATSVLKNFTKILALPLLNASSLSQKVVVAGWCLPLPNSTTTQAHNSCNKTIMDAYCAREYGSYAIWEQKDTVQVLLADSPPPSLSFSSAAAADQSDECPLYTACGECHYARYLANYSVVVGPTTTTASITGDENTYTSDPTLASPLFPFNNRNLPAIPINPQEDVSAVFITPSSTPTHSNVNNEDTNRGEKDDTNNSSEKQAQTLLFTPRPRPEYVTIRVHLKSDPFITLERLTQGSNQFVSYVSSDRFLATLQTNSAQSQQFLSSSQSVEASVIDETAARDLQKQKQQRASFVPAANNNNSGLNINAPLPDLPELSFRLLNKKYPPIGCGVPELICAWGVFLFMFAYLIVLCKKYPNYGIEADVDHDGIHIAYEDYDCETEEEGKRKAGGGLNSPDDVESDYDREERLASSGDALRIATIDDAQHTRTNSCSPNDRDRHVEEERVGKSELANRPSVSRRTSHVNRNAKSRHQQVMENFNKSENLGEGVTFSPLTGGNPNYNATSVRGKPNNNTTSTNHFELRPRGE